MKTLLLGFLIALSSSVYADDAKIRLEFISMLDLVSQYFQRDLTLLPEIPREQMSSLVELLRKTPERIQIVETRPVDNRGIEKAAVFYKNKNEVDLHRSTWVESSKNEQAMIAALELMGLSGVDKNRYEIVVHNIFPFPEDVAKLEKVQEQLCYQAGQQATSFGAAYMSAVWECRSQWKGMPRDYAKRAEVRYKGALARCTKECAYGNNDTVLRKGWCGNDMYEQIRKESKKMNGEKCL